MQVNKYCAKTIKDATALIKNNLGDDAMIVSTRRFRAENGKEMFEVTAASEKGGGTETGSNPLSSGKPDTADDIFQSFGALRSELINIKQLLSLLQTSENDVDKLMTNPAGLSFYAKLIRQGVEAGHAKSILQGSGAFENHGHNSADMIRKKSIQTLSRMIDIKNPFVKAGKGENQIIAAFVGTTGVGKTTTIAKLAAQLMLKHKKKVGLISIDNYRIGAMEQLKAYADILGIPCFQAFERKNMLFAFEKMKSKDVILIDTAGQSQYDLQRINELKQMIGNDAAIHSHLLLSAGTSPSEMIRTAQSFAALKFQTYIFTKIDESEKFGAILNQVMKFKFPVSYITCGQNVPEDIEPADRKIILNLLLKERQNNG